MEHPDLPYPANRCECHICTEHRCEDCKKLWGPYLARLMPHSPPRRREAIMATREKNRCMTRR